MPMRWFAFPLFLLAVAGFPAGAWACGTCLVQEVADRHAIVVIGALDGGWEADDPVIVVEEVLKNDAQGVKIEAGARLPFFIDWRAEFAEAARKKGRKPYLQTRTQGIWMLEPVDGGFAVGELKELQPLTPYPQYVDAVMGKLDPATLFQPPQARTSPLRPLNPLLGGPNRKP